MFDLKADEQDRKSGRAGDQAPSQPKCDNLTGRDVTVSEASSNIQGVGTFMCIFEIFTRHQFMVMVPNFTGGDRVRVSVMPMR